MKLKEKDLKRIIKYTLCTAGNECTLCEHRIDAVFNVAGLCTKKINRIIGKAYMHDGIPRTIHFISDTIIGRK